MKIIFIVSAILIFHTMIGYPLSLKLIQKLVRRREAIRDLSLRPYVSIIVPAHNEETIILDKLHNLISLNYPTDLIEIIISSDNSTDRTNGIVREFIKNYPNRNIFLYEVKERKGKTNAQNEAVRVAKGEILVFSDANAMLHEDAVTHLVSSFTQTDIIYVTGKLVYVNEEVSASSNAESNYWNYDLSMRKAESDIKTITAGNGAIYAIKKSEYINFDPIRCHDSAMPYHAGTNNKRAIFNEKAIAFEKAGTTSSDEFKRKVRMFRDGIKILYTDLQKYNVFKYGWFSYFYFSHRVIRRILFLLHAIALIANIFLIKDGIIFQLLLLGQIIFYTLARIGALTKSKNKFIYFPYYYTMTLAAQLVGTYNNVAGKSKPFWEKAESTR